MMKKNIGKNKEMMKTVMTTEKDTKCQCKHTNLQNTDPFPPNHHIQQKQIMK